jgi:hypothetical protein
MLRVSAARSISCAQAQLIFSDGANGRVLAYESPDNSALTVQSCIATCAGQNYTVAGLEYSVQCCECFLVILGIQIFKFVSLR